MDIFRFLNPTAPTKMQQGEIVTGMKSKLWVEKYAEAGEFKFVANASSGIKEKLPIGAFISHVDTQEIMMVENHEINDDLGKETEIVVSGRGFETFLENRITGANKVFPTTNFPTEYGCSASSPWLQAVILLLDHIIAGNLLNPDDEIPYVEVLTNIVAPDQPVVSSFKREELYKTLLTILNSANLGIKVVRPGPWSPLTPGSENTAFLIHRGVNRSGEIIFSYDTGEITSADYLWSNKKFKNAAVITGKWTEAVYLPGEVGIERRFMHIDGSDIDGHYTAAPAGGDLTTVVAAMQQRAAELLAAQINVALTKAEVSKDTNNSGYRTNFDVGDIITVSGSYNESTIKRISEYVEIEDEHGQNGYPTLTDVV